MGPRITRAEDGGLNISNLAPGFISLLLELPEVLAPEFQDDEAVKERLYPEPSGDEEQKKEWIKFVYPELFALIVDARTVVTRDLGGLVPCEEEELFGAWEMNIPKKHVNAWISALNAARLSIGAKHGVEEEDMADDEPVEDDAWTEKRVAVTKIHLLGWLQQMILEDRNPPQDELEIPDWLPPDIG